MKAFVLLILSWAIAFPCLAATLVWDAQPSGGALIVEKRDTPTGPFTTVATLPQGTTQFILTPGAWGHYRVRNSAGPSNTVQFSLDLYSAGVLDRLDTIEARLTVLEATPIVVEPPAPTVNISARQVDANNIEIVGLHCTSLKTTGTGLRRNIQCVP